MESLFNKVTFLGPATLSKKTPIQVLTCEICSYFEEHLWISTCKLYLKRDSNVGVFLWILWIIQEHLFCRWSTKDWFWNTSVGSLFNKVAILTAWRSLTVLKRDCSTGISLWILWNFSENFFAEHLLATTSHMMLFFSFCRSVMLTA